MTIEVSGADVVAANFARAIEGSRGGLQTIAQAFEAELLSRARAKAAGDVLQVHTGAYLDSIQGDVSSIADSVVGFVRSDAPAGGILEWGGTIPPHDISIDAAKALHFLGSAGDVYATSVHDPGGEIREHSAIHAAFDEMADEVLAGLQTAGLKPWTDL